MSDDPRSTADKASDEAFARTLIAASRAETPPVRAKARALAAALPELVTAHADIRQTHRAPRRWIERAALAAAASLLVALFGSGLVIKHQQDEQAAAKAAADQRAAAAEAQLDKLMAQLSAQNDAIMNLQNAVQNAKDDASRAAAVAQLDEAKRAQDSMKARVSTVRSSGAAVGGTRPARPACNCTPGDALCSCIP